MASPTQEELNFTKDSLATLVRLMQPLNATLGRPQDPELETLLQNYDVILQCRRKLQEEGPTEVISEHAEPSLVSALPEPPMEPAVTYHQTTIQAPHLKEIEPPQRTIPARPSISDPRTLPQYCQANIDLLYQSMTHRCSTCGLRFKTSDELSAHLDWHYFERTSHLGRQSGRGSKLQRQWYLSAKEWAETNGGTTGQLKSDDSKVSTVSTKEGAEEVSSGKTIVRINSGEHETQVICKACGDEIEQPEYDENGWFYPNTVRAADGSLHHEKCAPAPQLPLSHSTQSLIASTDSQLATPNNKKRAHGNADEETEFDELMVSPQAKKQKLD